MIERIGEKVRVIDPEPSFVHTVEIGPDFITLFVTSWADDRKIQDLVDTGKVLWSATTSCSIQADIAERAGEMMINTIFDNADFNDELATPSSKTPWPPRTPKQTFAPALVEHVGQDWVRIGAVTSRGPDRTCSGCG
jgi:hypothetical protein